MKYYRFIDRIHAYSVDDSSEKFNSIQIKCAVCFQLHSQLLSLIQSEKKFYNTCSSLMKHLRRVKRNSIENRSDAMSSLCRAVEQFSFSCHVEHTALFVE